MKTDWKTVCENVKSMAPATIWDAIKIIDGHTIYDPSQFDAFGPKIVKNFTQKLKSEDNYKGQLHDNDGKEVDTLTGIYGLDLLEFIAGIFQVNTRKHGRGSRADDLLCQLKVKLGV